MSDFSLSSDLLLVPSAIVVPDELRLDVGSVPTGMVPLRGKPMLERIADEYVDKDVTPAVAVGQASDSVHTYVSRSEHDWRVIDVGDTSSLSDTIATALESFDQEDLSRRNLFLNFADTLVAPIPDIDKDYVSYRVEDRSYRWTTFSIANGRIEDISEKYERDDGARPAFSGQFGFTDPVSFAAEISGSEGRPASPPVDFFEALTNYLSGRGYELYEPDTWYDVGHLDTYHRAKKSYLNAREFNELFVDDKNVITKKSTDTDTLANEIKWYTQIPTKLQPYLPRLYDWSTDPPEIFLDMEYIGYPSLADLQLYSAHGQHIWNNIFHTLFNMISEFQTYSPGSTAEEVQSALQDIYVEKTRRRLGRLKQEGDFTEFFECHAVSVNGIEYASVDRILSELERVIEDSGLLEIQSLSIIHGDMCLPNILYDPRNEIVKLIDPRGEFGPFTIYGDRHYDLAKLRHSFVGHYEHLINGQFSASMDQGEASISYEIDTTTAQEQREERFDRVLESYFPHTLSDVKLIEALLYLSMVPLHADSRDRQLCMLAQGLEKMSPYLE